MKACPCCSQLVVGRALRALYCSARCKKTAYARRLRMRMTAAQRARRAAVQRRYYRKHGACVSL